MCPGGALPADRSARKSFRRPPELNEKGAINYRRNRGRESARANCLPHQTGGVAKFSTFRQLAFSTIRNSTAVTRITSASDAGQSGFTGSDLRIERCFLQQKSEADCISTVHRLNALKTSRFEGQRSPVAILSRNHCCDFPHAPQPYQFPFRYLIHIIGDAFKAMRVPQRHSGLVRRLPLEKCE